MTELIERTDEYTIELDEEQGVPIFTYNAFVSGEELRDIARTWADFIASEDADQYVVNTESISAHDDADKRWLAETWIPDLIDHGVRHGAGVYADSAIASMDMEEIEGQLNAIDPDFEYRIFGSDDDALEWLAAQ
ncbi:hypothetical protein [Halopiger xanaduensis]|uniref:STAS/SEC14 domain-containing protein n=1 Tax=Halopiger xanaduensis (strain DSM 18323 / JCM 14033 / SH-6) TaxID=797210 RepID=F8D342_HALXS|nr:hypothetical protein [Halopiger xanaduensis]AEH37327.1 hypothetical protein Halxa_2710 [Halopiger xanaduensis SH-6]